MEAFTAAIQTAVIKNKQHFPCKNEEAIYK
jgi:hypothetical protein